LFNRCERKQIRHFITVDPYFNALIDYPKVQAGNAHLFELPVTSSTKTIIPKRRISNCGTEIPSSAFRSCWRTLLFVEGNTLLLSAYSERRMGRVENIARRIRRTGGGKHKYVVDSIKGIINY
jgi:hypothetical protein